MRTVRLGTCLEYVGSLPGWCKGVCRKKIETHRKIIEGSRKAYRDSGCTTATQVFGRLTAAEPPVPYFQGAFDGCTAGTGG
ncbi:hypothetical protein GW17_00060010 [Ensete ventricosum]|uniref:Uncharacterized protein n=1 Tax=Ensete ventricosum TaxID=4639 RepID=A0A444BZB4_ENSVE|nr:hypothetical protein GW17_00060010 [Ensete ventricosum]RZR75372.1 hypothetical protein BHM03_00055933 [Ensete ventricosum]